MKPIKARARVVFDFEYEMNPYDYNNATTFAEMRDIDLQNAENDIELFLADQVPVSVTIGYGRDSTFES